MLSGGGRGSAGCEVSAWYRREGRHRGVRSRGNVHRRAESVRELAAIAHEHGALGACRRGDVARRHPLDVAGWDLDAVYSCTQKCLGAPSGLSPIAWTPAAQARKVACRSFYLDLALLEDYWVRRKFHHTLSSTMIYALREALISVEEESLDMRWARHQRNHQALARGLAAIGLDLLPPGPERLWTLNAVRVPVGIDEAAVRQRLLEEFSIEIGAGLGPLAGKVWRVGLMGASSTRALLLLLLGALEHVLHGMGHKSPGGSAAAAMEGFDAGSRLHN